MKNSFFDIERCHLDYYCTKTWGELEVTDNPDIRFCKKCEHEVHLCKTLEEFDTKSADGRCVAYEIIRNDGEIQVPLGLPKRK